MDPTLAALMGAGIGSAGAVLVPWVTSRTLHTARRRALMQEAYAQGMRAMTNFMRVRSPGGYAELREGLLDAQVQIRLVGSRRTSTRFDEWIEVMNDLIDIATEEVSRIRPFTPPNKRAGSAFPREKRDKMSATYAAFTFAARRDIGTEDVVALRAWRRLWWRRGAEKD
jgi:hypothetical protein